MNIESGAVQTAWWRRHNIEHPRCCEGMYPHDEHIPAWRPEVLDEQLTGNPDGVTGPEIPDPPEPPPWQTAIGDPYIWQRGWRAGYEAARLDQGRTT